MSGLNKAILIGNVGQDPELKFTQGGQAVLSIRLATTEKYKNQAGELQERTEWHCGLKLMAVSADGTIETAEDE